MCHSTKHACPMCHEYASICIYWQVICVLHKQLCSTVKFLYGPLNFPSFYIHTVNGFFVQEEAWAAGGSGILLRTTNGGKTWTRDKAADNIAANLYSVKWVSLY